MWMLGGVLGLLAGAGAGGFGGAFAGLLVGGLGGWVLQEIVKSQVARKLGETEAKIKHIYDGLGDIHFRLKALEDAQAAGTPAVVSPAMRAVDAPVIEAAPAAAQPATGAHAAPAVSEVATDLLDQAADLPALPPMAAGEPKLVLDPLIAAMPAEPAAALPSSLAAEAAALADAAAGLVPPAAPATAAAAAAARPVAEKAEPATVRESTEPGFFARLFAGNLVAKAGVVILFFGVGFLLKYAYDHSILPPWTRLFGVAVASCGLFFAGRRLLEARRLYALILMGGGFGFLYLDVYFALKWYHYIDAPAGFGLFMLLGVATVLTAVRMDAQALAVLGLFGAFLAPPLASTGSGSHVLLFSYYALLNLFILAVSWFKAWRNLNLVGFGFTFLISGIWGARSYRPELFDSVEPFLLIFFAIYVAIPVLFATRQMPELKGLVDGTLVFGTPLAVAILQARLVAGMGDHALAWSAGGAGVLYAVLGAATRRREHMQLLGETHLALATVFLTMTVFFALDAYPTFALWTLEGAAIVWVGLRQQRALARAFGLLLQAGAALYFLAHYDQIVQGNPLFNDFVFGCALIALSAWITAWLMDRYREVLSEAGVLAGNLFLLWGWVWWFGGAVHALHHALAPDDFAPALLIFATASLACAELAGTWLGAASWPALRRVAAAHLGFILAAGLLAVDSGHPLANWGALAWPLAFAAHFWMIWRQRHYGLDAWLDFRYGAGWIALSVVASWEVWWLIDHDYYAAALAWSFGGFIAGWLRHALREREVEGAMPLSRAVLAWAILVWSVAGGNWLDDTWSGPPLVLAGLLAAALSVVVFELAGTLGRWIDLRRATALLTAAMLLMAGAVQVWHLHPFEGYAVLGWLSAFAVAWVVLWRQERAACAFAAPPQHLALLWLITGLLVWEAGARLDDIGAALQWQRAAWGAIPALLVAVVALLADRDVWPFKTRVALYRDHALWPLLMVLAGWSLYTNLAEPGEAVPAMHLPLLNPLDLTQLLAFAATWVWLRQSAPQYMLAVLVKPLLAALAFLWVNGVALRAIHYYAGVPYEWQAQLASVLAQSVLSLLWTSCALVLMTWASRRAARMPWSVGAALLGVVVVKLAFNDLGNSGTVERIVSFLGVGVLLLLIGYIAPLPPGQAAREDDGRG